MTTDYGTDVDAVLGWPDPERLASGPRNLANALARRLLTSPDALLDVGITDPYDCLNLRDWLGARPTDAEIKGLNTQMGQVLGQEDRVDTVTASATFAAGTISVRVAGTGKTGPFAFVLTIDAVRVATITVLQ